MTKVEERSKNVEHVIFFERTAKALPWILLDDIKRKKGQIQLSIYTQRPLLIKTETSKTAEKQLYERKQVKRLRLGTLRKQEPWPN